MTWKSFLIAALLTPVFATAQAEGRQQYISDDVGATLRDKPSNDAGVLGVLKSGTHVTVLQVLGADSFAHVRAADGRDGWVTAHFLSDEPAARDQLAPVKQQLQDANSKIQELQSELQADQQQLAKAKPALDMAADNDKLRAAITEREHAASELEGRFDQEAAHRRTMLTGAGLLAGGILLGLVLPWFRSGGRKRYRGL